MNITSPTAGNCADRGLAREPCPASSFQDGRPWGRVPLSASPNIILLRSQDGQPAIASTRTATTSRPPSDRRGATIVGGAPQAARALGHAAGRYRQLVRRVCRRCSPTRARFYRGPPTPASSTRSTSPRRASGPASLEGLGQHRRRQDHLRSDSRLRSRSPAVVDRSMMARRGLSPTEDPSSREWNIPWVPSGLSTRRPSSPWGTGNIPCTTNNDCTVVFSGTPNANCGPRGPATPRRAFCQQHHPGRPTTAGRLHLRGLQRPPRSRARAATGNCPRGRQQRLL